MGEVLTILSGSRSVDEKKWRLFTGNHPRGNIFHSPWMVNLHLSAKDSIPYALFCVGADQNIIGLLVAYVMKEGSGIVSFLTSRAVIWGGPLALDDNVTVCELLLKSLKANLKGEIVFIQIRNLFDTGHLRLIFEKEQFMFEDHLDILFDLQQPVKSLWSGVHPTRRKQINRALRRGVSTYITMDPSGSETEVCYQLLSKIYRKTKLPLPRLSFFLKARELNEGGEKLGMAAALYAGQIIGFVFSWFITV